MERHLTPELVGALLAGALEAAEEKATLAHLGAGECPVCAAVLAALSAGDEAALLAAVGRLGGVPREPPAALRQAVLDAALEPPWWRRAWVLGPALAGVAVAGLLLLAWPRPPSPPAESDGQRLKGAAAVGGVALELVYAPGGAADPSRLERVAGGARLDPRGQLVFRVRVEGACHLYLLRVDDRGLEVLLPDGDEPPATLQAGAHVPARDGAPLALALAELAGPQRFVAVCAPGPLSPDALRSAAGPGEAAALQGRTAEVRIRVGAP